MILLLLSGLVATPVNFDPQDGYQNVSVGFINAPKSLYVPDVGILSFPWSGVGSDDEAFSLHRVLQGLLDSANGNAGFTDPDAFFAALWQTQCEDPLDADPRTNCEPQDQNGFPTHCADQGFCDLVQDTTPSDFKPYALINRFDLMNEKSCGQGRIIFQRKTLFDGTVDDQEIDKLPLVIFEMNVPNPAAGSACPIDDGCRAWAERWAELSELDRDQRRAALMEMYFDGYGPYQPVIQWSAVREGVGAVRIFGDQNHFTTESETWNNDMYRFVDACNPPHVAGSSCTVTATPNGPLGGITQNGTCQPLPATGRLSCAVANPVPELPLGFFQVNLSIVGLLGPVDDPPNRPGKSEDKVGGDDDESFAALVGQKSEGATGAAAAKMTLTSSAPHLAWHKGLLASAPHPELFANDSAFFDWFLQRGVPVLARATHITHMDLPGAGTTAYPTPGVANTQDGIMYGVTDTQTYAGFGQVDAPHQTHVNLNAPYAGTFTSAPTRSAESAHRPRLRPAHHTRQPDVPHEHGLVRRLPRLRPRREPRQSRRRPRPRRLQRPRPRPDGHRLSRLARDGAGRLLVLRGQRPLQSADAV